MNTQQAILEILQKQPTVYAEDLSQVLSKTRANIQYHLKLMEKAGWIEQIQPVSIIKSQGRPRNYYALASRGRANNYIHLANALLKSLLPVDASSPEFKHQVEKIARALLPQTVETTALTPTRQLNQLAKELTSQGYQARWEARSAGPSFVFRNCPYYAILPQHPELCLIDAAILKNFLFRDVTQQARIQLPQVTACRFNIR